MGRRFIVGRWIMLNVSVRDTETGLRADIGGIDMGGLPSPLCITTMFSRRFLEAIDDSFIVCSGTRNMKVDK